MVIVVAVAVLLLSGLALYVAFRLRETFREEKGMGARAAKAAFLVGLLFLSGGVFYYFANGFVAAGSSGTTLVSTSTSTGPASNTALPATAETTTSATSASPAPNPTTEYTTVVSTVTTSGATTYVTTVPAGTSTATSSSTASGATSTVTTTVVSNSTGICLPLIGCL